ncbi:diiron oxygenase [Rhodococcus sp. X156]|uniref:AurF N-oxygenase family protein n=1 Tax=Rhodococcus sp. X156 TaxID=2499145 RepID=UPI000FDBC0AD|nr:diiron oxygenase [Rhodococcus sp. X156]
MSSTTTSSASRGVKVTDRQEIASRLLSSAAKKSYDPMVEVDWQAPVPDHLFGLTPEWSTLYGTSLWEEMSLEQQVTLTKHEVSSIMSTGIWFEMILMQMVVRDIYGQDASTPHFQFALTEIADECRHSIMFARAAERFGAPAYRPSRTVLELGRVFKATAVGATAYAGILVAEEILDVMQRDWMRDERVQPITRTTAKIHVLEEARHMRFAREEIARRVQGMSAAQRARERAMLAAGAYFITTSLVHPDVYAAAGLDPKRAMAAARTNEHYRARLRDSAAKLMAFLDEVGLVGGPSVRLYKKISML